MTQISIVLEKFCYNLFFSIVGKFAVKSIDFLEEFGTLYNLLIYLLGKDKRINISSENQLKFFEAITALKTIVSSMKTDITDQSEEQKKKFRKTRECFK